MNILRGENAHPDTRWFENAGLGLFLHWGLSSVSAIGELSWSMIRDKPYVVGTHTMTPEEYWRQAAVFNPDHYDPHHWLATAKKAGFAYALLTARHHDGYALWPSAFGEFSTRTHLGGRDLLKPFVEACRHHGLKVGFYYSPPDWYRARNRMSFRYTGTPQLGTRHEPIVLPTPTEAEEKRWAEEHNAYVKGQVEELLTNYGKLDIIWFDGPAPSVPIDRIRALQPGILINDRGHGEHLKCGDFSTYEGFYCRVAAKRPERLFEFCTVSTAGDLRYQAEETSRVLNRLAEGLGMDRGQLYKVLEVCQAFPEVLGDWGHQAEETFRPTSKVLAELVKVRAWGGNYLLNIGPKASGELPEGGYRLMAELGVWMQHSGESVRGASGGPWPEQSNVPITQKDRTWYLHLLPGVAGPATVRGLSQPQGVRLLRTGQDVAYTFVDGVLQVAVPEHLRSDLVDVVAVAG